MMTRALQLLTDEKQNESIAANNKECKSKGECNNSLLIGMVTIIIHLNLILTTYYLSILKSLKFEKFRLC